MKLVYLHLSDIHIRNDKDVSIQNIEKIADTLNTVDHIDRLCIVISGDITDQGKHEQFDSAYEMIQCLRKRIMKFFKLKSVDVLVVPGNHDVDLTNDKGHKAIQSIIRDGVTDGDIENELCKQRHYFNFSNGIKRIQNDEKICNFYQQTVQEKRIVTCLLNTAIFSTLDEDKGLHYLPESELVSIEKNLDGDVNILVMHHAHHWFNDRIKNRIEQIIQRKCHIVICGHEHEMKTQVIKCGNNEYIYLNGGELSDKGDWSRSQFYIDTIDLEQNELNSRQYVWNEAKARYDINKNECYRICHKSDNNKFCFSKEFENLLYNDPITDLPGCVFDYFVFPNMEEIDEYSTKESTVISDEEVFLDRIIEYKRVSIVGGENFGKTVLLKRVYTELQRRGYVCLYCDIANANIQSLNKLIPQVFRENYDDINGEYETFSQMPKYKKVFLIDNIDDIEKTKIGNVLDYLRDFFGVIVYSTGEVIELDLTERIKQNIEMNQYKRYRIMPMILDRRKKLINKIVCITDEKENDEIVERISNALKKQRKFYSMNPCFVIQFTQYYLKNFKDGYSTEGNVFSKVFESNLVNRLLRVSPKITVEKVFVLLDQIAYWSFKKQINHIPENAIFDLVSEYNEVHDDDVSCSSLINDCVASKILMHYKGSEYRFCNKNVLSYFVARQIIRLWNDNLDDSDLEYLTKYIKYGVHSNVILFVTYLTDSLFMIRKIIESAQKYTQGWGSFNPKKTNIGYLNKINTNMPIDPPKPSDKIDQSEKENHMDKRELEEYEKEQIMVCDYFADDLEDVDAVVNQIIRGMTLLSIVSKCLPGFEHRMDKRDKEMVVGIMQQLPSMIFYLWAIQVDKEKDDIVKYLLDSYRNVYLKPKDWDRVNEKDMLLYLQIESLSLYLDLLNIPVEEGIRKHTIKYLEKYSSDEDNPSNFIQMMMAYAKCDNKGEFDKYLNNHKESLNTPILNYMKMRVLSRYLISSEKLSEKELQRYISLYYPTKRANNEYRKILLGRERNKKKK